MKWSNINILGTGVYQPDHMVGNDFYLNIFKDISDQLKIAFEKTGKLQRGIINNEHENALTMAIEATYNVLKSTGISSEEIDMIVFTSDTPEYLSPSNALIISHIIGAKNAHITYDINANCLGMLVALDQVSSVMKSKKNIRYTLVVSGIYASSISREDCLVTYPMVGDVATAVILEKREEDKARGFLDAKYRIFSQYYENSLSPACGMTKARKDSVTEYDRKIRWVPFDMNFCPDIWGEMVKAFAKEYDFSIEEVEYFFLSQLTKGYGKKLAEKLDVENYEEKIPYVGDVYGYTGATSPILALHHMLQQGTIKTGSIAIFASVGTGLILGANLYKF